MSCNSLAVKTVVLNENYATINAFSPPEQNPLKMLHNIFKRQIDTLREVSKQDEV